MAGSKGGSGGRGQHHGWSGVRRWPALVVEATVGNVGLFVLVAVGGWLTARSWPTSWWLWWALLAVMVMAAVVLGLLLWRRRRQPGPRPAAWREALAGLVLVMALCAMALVIVTFEEVDDCDRPVDGTVLDVVVVWEGAELADFCSVAAQYGRVEVDSVGEDIGAALDAREGSPPDVAVIPQPSLVRRYATADRLCSIDDDVTDRFPARWNEFSTVRRAGSGAARIYGAMVKGALKSILWYNPALLGEPELGPQDWTWDDLGAWVDAHDDGGSGVAALTVPAGDRWPLTDWFESQLAGTDPELYERLSSGDVQDWHDSEVKQPIEDVLNAMAMLWRDKEAFGDRAEANTELHWEDAPGVLYDGDAVFAFGPSFLAGPIEDLPGNFALTPVGFPEMEQGRPFVVGGDLAVVPRPPGGCSTATEGSGFVDFVTGEKAQELWTGLDPGFLSPGNTSPFFTDDEPGVPIGDENVRLYLTFLLRETPAEQLHFDLSDDQFAGSGSDARGTWGIFFDFYTDVTGGAAVPACAVDRVMLRLEAEYEGTEVTDISCTPDGDAAG